MVEGTSRDLAGHLAHKIWRALTMEWDLPSTCALSSGRAASASFSFSVMAGKLCHLPGTYTITWTCCLLSELIQAGEAVTKHGVGPQ